MTTDREPPFTDDRPAPPRVCHACGMLTPSDIPRCLECGAWTPEAIEEIKAARFVDVLRERKAFYSYVFFWVNIGVFILMAVAGGATDPAVLLGFGAKETTLIQSGEWWRLVTPIFLHIGLLHLAINNYALWGIGPQLEVLYGPARFFVIYVLTGVGAIVASFLFTPGVSAGCSGALVGMIGVFAGFVLRYRGEIPELLRRHIQSRVFFIIVLNVVLNFMVSVADVSGHAGGFLLGVAAVWVIPFQRIGEKGEKTLWRAIQVVCALVLLVPVVMGIIRYDGPRLPTRPMHIVTGLVTLVPGMWGSYWEGPTGEFLVAFNQAEAVYKLLNQTLHKPDKEALPRILQLNQEAQRELRQTPPISRSAGVLCARTLDLLREQEVLLQAPDLPGDALQKNHDVFIKLKRDWLATDGKRMGLVDTDEPQQ
ncbi:MAG: rhomboid family intramembrane serine protease [Blastocatellia bacterium]|nr:rhomboid family intramembrane serine protease [Blastocatellia bacterium]